DPLAGRRVRLRGGPQAGALALPVVGQPRRRLRLPRPPRGRRALLAQGPRVQAGLRDGAEKPGLAAALRVEPVEGRGSRPRLLRAPLAPAPPARPLTAPGRRTTATSSVTAPRWRPARWRSGTASPCARRRCGDPCGAPTSARTRWPWP